jgi:3-hydroxyacyl-CoA dehydrogenase
MPIQSAGDTHHQFVIPSHKIMAAVNRFADNFDIIEPFQDFFPQDAQLHFCHPVAKAAMQTEPKGQMLSGLWPVDHKLFGLIEVVFVEVAGQIPHDHLIAGLDRFAAHFDIFCGGPAHMRQGGLPANDFRHEAFYQRWIGAQFGKLVRIVFKRNQTPCHRVPGRVIAAHHQQPQVAIKIRFGLSVVNDSRGFYATRGFRSFSVEGLAMVAEGINPALIENAARQVGMPVGPLAVQDAVSLELTYSVRKQTMADLGNAYVPDAGHGVVFTMVEKAGRLGRKAGAGFYTYHDDGSKDLWAGLEDFFPRAAHQPAFETCVKRLAYIQSLEAVRCMEEGVVTDPRDADIGSVLGWGFPIHRGGAISQIQSVGLTTFIAECEALVAEFGSRFEPPKMLRDMAERGETFYAA